MADFLPAELIRKKRFGGVHTRAELAFLVQEYSQGKIPDYQMAAWLMAVCFKGMTAEETHWLTLEMCDSGARFDLKRFGASVDKHSTGGVGDKTSLILAPLVAAAGVTVPMMAGRGLGHSGGTLDKLEAIAGFSVALDFSAFERQLAEVGTAIIGQTSEICPADRKLYALRDVTGTVDSLPLICGSIMSKKLAEGASALVLDVKCGSGAFMKSLPEAEALARALCDLGRRAGRRMTALITRMDEPLGRFIGHALEVRECLDIMEGKAAPGPGKGHADTIELTLELAAHMLLHGGKATDIGAARRLARELLENGSARRKFTEICERQGGDLARIVPAGAQRMSVLADNDGHFEFVDIERLGTAGVLLGAGRRFQGDVIDHGAGIEVFCEQGQTVRKGDEVFKLYASDAGRFEAALGRLRDAYRISPERAARSPLIAKVLT